MGCHARAGVPAAPYTLAQNDVNFTVIAKEAVSKPKAIYFKREKGQNAVCLK